MASKQETLEEAIKQVREKEISLRKASMKYGIPKSSLSLYVNGKIQLGSRRGPASVLTREEEEKLVEYATHMAQIGYGCTRKQILDIVAKIVAKDGRPNPFINGKPGRKWWSLFRKRNALVTLRTPEKLQLARAKCCTPEILGIWYDEFKTFLEEHGLLNKPQHLWNADEAGFPLCSTSGKVLSVRGCKNVYSITADTKEQITVLCAISASGEAIPPMEIFPGVRFKYNPMVNCVEGAYFGHSPSGWSTAELFYAWVANHFSKKVIVRPVVLLVDGHASHIDLHTSTFCKENNILLYCLPPHSSHLTQPLDVSFYKPLKAAWGKACSNYCSQNPGYQVTKHEFSQVFREAWISCVRLSTVIHGFLETGLCPFNRDKVLTEDKLLPSMQFSSKECLPKHATEPLSAIEDILGPEKVKKYQERYEEGFDIATDELYCVWLKMKKLSVHDVPPPSRDLNSALNPQPSNPCPGVDHSSKDPPTKGSVLDDILVYPTIPESKCSGKSKRTLPMCLSGEQFVQYLQEKKDEKERIEEEKRQRQSEREQKKRERELQKAHKEEERRKKQLEREKKREEAEKQKNERRGCGRRRGRGRGRGSAHTQPEDSLTEDCGQGHDHRRGRGRTQARGCHNTRAQSGDLPVQDRRQGRGRRYIPIRGRSSAHDQSESSSSEDDCEQDNSYPHHEDSPNGSTASEENSGSEGYLCGVCCTSDDGKWIQCDKCDDWFHCSCVDLPDDSSLDSVDWFCSSCNC